MRTCFFKPVGTHVVGCIAPSLVVRLALVHDVACVVRDVACVVHDAACVVLVVSPSAVCVRERGGGRKRERVN